VRSDTPWICYVLHSMVLGKAGLLLCISGVRCLQEAWVAASTAYTLETLGRQVTNSTKFLKLVSSRTWREGTWKFHSLIGTWITSLESTAGSANICLLQSHLLYSFLIPSETLHFRCLYCRLPVHCPTLSSSNCLVSLSSHTPCITAPACYFLH